MQLTGQRHALAVATLVLAALAIAALKLSDSRWLWIVAAAGTGVFALLWTWRMLWPPGRIDPAKPGVLLSFARAARTNLRAVAAYRYVAQTVLPALFLLVSGLAVLALGHRATFDLLSAGGEFCKATDNSRDQARRTVEAQAASTGTKDGVDEKLEPPATFVTDSRCHKTGLRLVAGRKYRIRLDMERGPDGEWFDQGRRVDVAGFAADDWRHYSATPLKRWWRENWFQSIARIGEVGNYEHVLRPAEPLPVVNFSKKCPPELAPSVWDAITNTSTPAPTPVKLAQLQCDPGEPRPNRTLISDITANATGELFLYVNDAVLTLPGLTDVFYKNNSGKAKVTVTQNHGGGDRAATDGGGCPGAPARSLREAGGPAGRRLGGRFQQPGQPRRPAATNIIRCVYSTERPLSTLVELDPTRPRSTRSILRPLILRSATEYRTRSSRCAATARCALPILAT